MAVQPGVEKVLGRPDCSLSVYKGRKKGTDFLLGSAVVNQEEMVSN